MFSPGESHAQRTLAGYVGSQRVRRDWVTNTSTSSLFTALSRLHWDFLFPYWLILNSLWLSQGQESWLTQPWALQTWGLDPLLATSCPCPLFLSRASLPNKQSTQDSRTRQFPRISSYLPPLSQPTASLLVSWVCTPGEGIKSCSSGSFSFKIQPGKAESSSFRMEEIKMKVFETQKAEVKSSAFQWSTQGAWLRWGENNGLHFIENLVTEPERLSDLLKSFRERTDKRQNCH